MKQYAGRPYTQEQLRGTLALLRYYRRFLASDKALCVNPEGDRFADPLTKAQAEARLHYLVNVAVNRRAHIPDVPSRKYEHDEQVRFRRDKYKLADIRNRVRVYQFETRQVRERFGHLLANHND